MFDGVDHSLIKNQSPRSMTWDFVKRLQDTTTMKLYIKGVLKCAKPARHRQTRSPVTTWCSGQ